jgi:putative membrane protein
MNDVVKMLANFFLTGLSVVIVAALLPGMKVKKFTDAVGFAVVVGVLNVLLGKAITQIPMPNFALPFGGMVLAFFGNGLIFLIAKKFVSGVEISGCLVAAIGALLVSVSNSLLVHVLADVLR